MKVFPIIHTTNVLTAWQPGNHISFISWTFPSSSSSSSSGDFDGRSSEACESIVHKEMPSCPAALPGNLAGLIDLSRLYCVLNRAWLGRLNL